MSSIESLSKRIAAVEAERRPVRFVALKSRDGIDPEAALRKQVLERHGVNVVLVRDPFWRPAP